MLNTPPRCGTAPCPCDPPKKRHWWHTAGQSTPIHAVCGITPEALTQAQERIDAARS